MCLYAFNTFDLLILCFLKYFRFFDDFRPKILIFDAYWYLYKTQMEIFEKNLVLHCNLQCNDQPEA